MKEHDSFSKGCTNHKSCSNLLFDNSIRKIKQMEKTKEY